ESFSRAIRRRNFFVSFRAFLWLTGYKNIMTEPEPLHPIDSLHLLFRGRRLLSFSGCDYFRLSSHPTVRRAAARELGRSNLNVAASRLTTGNHPIYRVLEKQLARFFGAEDALMTSSGYA